MCPKENKQKYNARIIKHDYQPLSRSSGNISSLSLLLLLFHFIVEGVCELL
jgi:hypothetical protein